MNLHKRTDVCIYSRLKHAYTDMYMDLHIHMHIHSIDIRAQKEKYLRVCIHTDKKKTNKLSFVKTLSNSPLNVSNGKY